MKDDKFWKIIEEQNPERKEKNWEKLKTVLQSEENENNVILVKTRRIKWSYKRIASVCASAVLLLGICTSVGVYIKRQNDGEAGKSRFCTQDQYGLSISEMNLKEYASFINKELLYFDWYDNCEYLADYTYVLLDTEETLGFREEMQHAETLDFITLSVTDNKTKLEEFDLYEIVCENEEIVNDVKIIWTFSSEYGYMKWEYKGFQYYLEIEEPADSETMIRLVRELLM